MSVAGALLAERTVQAERAPESDRAARARAALARAEQRTGTERWVRPTPVPDLPEPAPVHAVVPVAVHPAARPVSAPPEPAAGERLLPVAPHLSALLPSGALERGTTVVVSGSTSLTLALVAEASRNGSWVALVGLPAVGVLAAHQLGLCLDRVVLVPAPGPDGPTVVAALLDGVDVVVVGPAVALGSGDRRRLSARARERSAVLIPTEPWTGAHVVLTAEASRWEGLGRGWGRLSSRQLTVHRTGRGTAARARRCDVALPGTSSPWHDEPVTRGLPDADAALKPAVVQGGAALQAGVPAARRAG